MTAAQSGPPLVSVVVVNYNGGQDLAENLAALCSDAANSAVPMEIFVVDNASTDGSLAHAESVAAENPTVRVLASAVNRGYAGGANLALREARGAYVAVLNQDVVVDPDWLAPLAAFLAANPSAGAVNPLILLHADDDRINAAGQDVHVTGLGFNRWLGRPRAVAGARPIPVSGLQGGAVVVRRALLEQMGGWDESGFLYHEDVELSWRLRLMGYDLFCLPAAVVRHKYHLTMYPEKLFLLERNRLAMLLANLRYGSLCLLAPWLAVTELLMWGYCALRGWRFLAAKANSYAWLLRRWPKVRARRTAVQRARRRTDWQVLSRLRWGYAWDQFLALGRERGLSRRVPAGGLPVEAKETS